MRPAFYAIKTIKPIVSYIPNLFDNYLCRENRKLVNYSFNCIMEKGRKLVNNKECLDHG